MSADEKRAPQEPAVEELADEQLEGTAGGGLLEPVTVRRGVRDRRRPERLPHEKRTRKRL